MPSVVRTSWGTLLLLHLTCLGVAVVSWFCKSTFISFLVDWFLEMGWGEMPLFCRLEPGRPPRPSWSWWEWGPSGVPQVEWFSPTGTGREREGPRAKATAWTGKASGNQESESRLEGHAAKRRAEGRTHSKGPKQRESVNDEQQGEKIRAGGLQGFPRQSGDACGDFKSHPWASLYILPRSLKSIMVRRTSLVVRRPRLHAPNAEGLGSTPGQGTISHILKLKMLCDATNTQCSQVNKFFSLKKKKGITVDESYFTFFPSIPIWKVKTNLPSWESEFWAIVNCKVLIWCPQGGTWNFKFLICKELWTGGS